VPQGCLYHGGLGSPLLPSLGCVCPCQWEKMVYDILMSHLRVGFFFGILLCMNCTLHDLLTNYNFDANLSTSTERLVHNNGCYQLNEGDSSVRKSPT
jgi:hypothetical protein